MQDDRFLTKIFDSSRGPSPLSDDSGSVVPSLLLRQGASRIPIVAAAALFVQLVGWVIPLTARGDFLEEFTRVWDWVPPIAAITASIAMIAATKVFQIPPRVTVTLGLLYQVVISYSVTFSQYWHAFSDVTADHINGDIVGMTVVAVWMVFYTVIVPARPRYALVALLGSSSAPGVVYFLSMSTGDAPVLGGQHFFFVFVFPYLLVASCAFIAALIVYRLGQAVSAAREMGSYRLEDRLGEGGMGEVWRASHRMLARPAAVKLVRTDSLGWDRDTAVARFEREAQVTAALQSPHTVELYDYGVSEDGTIYYVMELLEGVDLDELVKQHGALPAERVVHILRQVCASLGEAHRRNLIHRDVKPANIFLCKRAFEYDFVKVLDFGLVRKHSTVDPEAPANELSQMGMVMGTPAYIAPEVINGEPADARSDIYAVGCVAYWLLTGEKVFDSPTLAALLVAHASKEPVPPSQRAGAKIPVSLDALVLDCLKKDPADRVQNADEIVERLRTVEFGDQWTQERAENWWAEVV
ncbi:serine/threonine-protein kinase [Gemmatimonadota bacterium]